MAILNYTTTVDSFKTVSEIETYPGEAQCQKHHEKL